MTKWLALTAVIAMSCAPSTTAGAPSASASQSLAATAPTGTTAGALPGTTFSMPTTDDMTTFVADRGAIVAFSTTTATPHVFHSKIQRAEAPSGPWMTVYEADALWLRGSVAAGRAAISEYRESSQDVGAYSSDVILVDLSTGKATAVDRFSMSGATFHGGGGGPRRPSGAVALGPDAIAWTRLLEGPAGSVSGELRVATFADLTRPTVIGASSEWIAPLGFAGRRLVYVAATKTDESLHLRDLDTSTDRIIASGPVGRTERGEFPVWDQAVIAGHWAVSSIQLPNEPLRVLDLDSGVERTFQKGDDCGFPPSAGTRYIVLTCAGPSMILDTVTLAPVAHPLATTDRGVTASADGLIWFDVTFTPRHVVLYRPR